MVCRITVLQTRHEAYNRLYKLKKFDISREYIPSGRPFKKTFTCEKSNAIYQWLSRYQVDIKKMFVTTTAVLNHTRYVQILHLVGIVYA